mgnify:CR=1 FL=1
MVSKLPVSTLAPSRFPSLPAINGLRLATAGCGIKRTDRDDILLIEFDSGTTVAGVLTRSKMTSAPVDWCRKNLAGGQAQALLVNSGNANAFTGSKGQATVEEIVNAIAETLTCRPSRVFMASTGVIGEYLPSETITSAMDMLCDQLTDGNDPKTWEAAASAILTTDTFPKGATASALINGTKVNIVGIAKGSGMIAPDMATMLSFIFTDAAIESEILQNMLSDANLRTFNSITVDSDTSTSDTVLLFATGSAGNIEVNHAESPNLKDFRCALECVMRDLAHQIVRDGEGASKFITINVTGAENEGSAKVIALAIANSPLVKTAIAGEDANWGRIVMAVGKAGELANRDNLAIRIGGIQIAANGEAVKGYEEAPVTKHMHGQEVNIDVDVGVATGSDAGSATVWTCDLTHGYISINADYRS